MYGNKDVTWNVLLHYLVKVDKVILTCCCVPVLMTVYYQLPVKNINFVSLMYLQ